MIFKGVILASVLCLHGSIEPFSWRSIVTSMMFWKSSAAVPSKLSAEVPVEVPKPKFIAREVDYKNQQEIDEVIELCLREQPLHHQEDQTLDDLQKEEQRVALEKKSIVSSMQKTKNNILFVCVSSKNNKICGALFCRYGYRRPQMAEYMRIVIHEDYKFDDVMFAMNQHAEKVFVALSMKQIAHHAWSKCAFEFYLQHGFLVMDHERQKTEYFIFSDAVTEFLFILTLIPMLIIKLCDYGVVYKNIQ